MNSKKLTSFLSLSLGMWVFVTFMTAREAHAYLDPGTLGMALQVIVAAVAGGFMFFRNGWARTKVFVARLSGRKPADDVISKTE